ncbi:MAG: SET domain-containing protein-lysine N-methyltransferase [Verrucomicrobiota bacterium]
MVFGLEVPPRLWQDGSSEDNPARVANHSCEPNADLVWDEAEAAAWLSARQDLPAGTEVTFDYGFSLAEALTHPCLCGSPSCVGRIVAAPLRAALRRHLRHPGARRD